MMDAVMVIFGGCALLTLLVTAARTWAIETMGAFLRAVIGPLCWWALLMAVCAAALLVTMGVL